MGDRDENMSLDGSVVGDDSYNKGGSGRNNRNNYPTREWTNSHYKNNDNSCLRLFLKQEDIGKVIGRGGSKIRELQQDSGARINIDKNGNSAGAPMRITGSKDSQEKARELIENLIGSELSSNSSHHTNNREPRGDYRPRQNNYNERQNNQRSYNQSFNDSHQTQKEANDEPKQSNNEPNHSNDNNQPSEVQEFGDFDWTEANEEYKRFQEERIANLKPMKKNFYFEDPEITNLTDEEVKRIRLEKNNIECKRVFESENEFEVPKPIFKFEHAFKKYPEILEEIRKQGFEHPSPIQCQAWPILLSGKDLIGIAQTGTGKTLAFLLPALIHIDGQDTPRHLREGPNVIIMAPTRELALQINKEVSKYQYRGIKSVCIYGGGNRKEQMHEVEKGVNIVIATPGRFNDLVNSGVLSVKEVSFLILDEADRMLDMGFEPQIRKTLLEVRPDRQTIMTSATWPPGVRRLAESYMRDPIQVCVGSLDLAAVHSVTQTIIMIDESEKTDMIHDFVKKMGPDDKAIIFFGKKTRVDDLASEFALQNINVQSIHGGRDQLDREQALDDLKSGEAKILLATDVASRGIDIEDITHVINYDFPRDIEEYVHRVGRTGRAGRTGESISFFTRGDWGLAKELIAILEEAQQEIPKELYEMSKRFNAWKERKMQEKDGARMDSRGSGRYGGGYYGNSGGGGRGGGNFRGNRSGRGGRW